MVFASLTLPAHSAGGPRLTGLEVAALPRGAGGVGDHVAGAGVAAGVVAVLLQAAVALLAGLHEPVPTDRTLEQGPGLVPETGVHTCSERT